MPAGVVGDVGFPGGEEVRRHCVRRPHIEIVVVDVVAEGEVGQQAGILIDVPEGEKEGEGLPLVRRPIPAKHLSGCLVNTI